MKKYKVCVVEDNNIDEEGEEVDIIEARDIHEAMDIANKKFDIEISVAELDEVN